jgi:hypothetical protein
MKFYMIVMGKGKARRILTWVNKRETCVNLLNRAILDCGIHDARLVVTSIQPPKELWLNLKWNA